MLPAGPAFNRYDTEYELVVDSSITSVNITANASASSASVTGAGIVTLTEQVTPVTITVQSGSGNTRTYTIYISRMSGGQTGESETIISGTDYIFDSYVKGVNERTEYDEFMSKVTVKGGSINVEDKNGQSVTSGIIATGMKAVLKDKIGNIVSEYKVLIKGDINGDGKTNSADALAVQRHIVETRVLEDVYLEAADINQDGRVNSLDVLYVQKHIVGSYTIEN